MTSDFKCAGDSKCAWVIAVHCIYSFYFQLAGIIHAVTHLKLSEAWVQSCSAGECDGPERENRNDRRW